MKTFATADIDQIMHSVTNVHNFGSPKCTPGGPVQSFNVTCFFFTARLEIDQRSGPNALSIFDIHYSLLSFWLPQQIHNNLKALTITYSICCDFVELAEKFYNP